MEIHILDSLASIRPDHWNALVEDHNPFVSHEFLAALERHDCVGERTGWLPRHMLCFDEQNRLIGAVPLYLKDNSYGEFVFDWGWAEAYRRHGLPYYPKLVSAIPFTPATGQRLLLAPGIPRQQVAGALVAQALEQIQAWDCSSLHCLFITEQDRADLLAQGLLLRLSCQFHWHNQGYRDFQDFLDTLSTKKRKNIKRERRRVQEAGITIQVLHGHEADEAQWRFFHQLYCSTFSRLGGYPTLTLPFFLELSTTLNKQIVLMLAQSGNRPVAAALSFAGDHALYGRHWGCSEDYHSLHFETCYYQGIEYCIQHGLQVFEPGAQGEHKISRGFLPTLTYSAHWLAHPGFHQAVADFLARETPAVASYVQELTHHSPYRQEPTTS